MLVEDGKIRQLGPSQELQSQHPDEHEVDARGQLVLPGNLCAHTHFYGAFARGMAIPGRPPRDFPAILTKLWWPLDKALGQEDIRYSALVCLLDAIRHGTTTLIDHHASPHAIQGSLDTIAEAVDQSGLRAVLCYEVSDRDGTQKARAGIEENLRFMERCGRESVAGGRVAAAFGLHASMTLSDETLRTCRDRAPESTAFHIHVAEHEADEYDSLARSGSRVVDRLAEHGIINGSAIVAHAVHIDSKEMAILADHQAWVTHQPRSNMNNGVGAAEVEAMLRLGIRVCLGNDGFSNAMWEEWKAAYLFHKVWHRDPRRMPADTVVRMACLNNAALAGKFFPEAALGVIEEGAHADLVFVDYEPTTPMNPDNLPWHVIFGFHESMVTTTIVAGKLLMRDREVLTMDEGAIKSRARQLAAEVWKRYPNYVPADTPPALSASREGE